MRHFKGILAVVMVFAMTAVLAFPGFAENSLKVNYSGYSSMAGWSKIADDGSECTVTGSVMTAIKFNLLNQIPGMTGTIAYQVNQNGYGWLPWVENGRETGHKQTDRPLESIAVKLTGQLKDNYDIYYTVSQDGIWENWESNGEPVGLEEQGYRIDGLRLTVQKKGSLPPPEPLNTSYDPDKPMIALTFDDGPEQASTTRIINCLKNNGARATFFMVGNRIGRRRAVVQQMTAWGCEAANHTLDHKKLTVLDSAGILSQIMGANDAVTEASGITPVLMRPPGGSYNDKVLSAVGSANMSAVLWSLDTEDWKTRDAAQTVSAVLDHVQDGDIVLMHDLYSTTADAVEIMVPELISRGYQLVTVSELAAARGGIVSGNVYRNFRK